MTRLRGIQPHELGEWWPIAAPLLERGMSYGAGYRWTLEGLRDRVARNDFWLWLTWPDKACALLTRFDIYPKSKVFHLFWIGGRLPNDWKQVLRDLEQFATEQGCTEIETGGRNGWARVMPGYRRAPWTPLLKEI